ncbi:MAG: hypothetical protein LBD73_06630 [Deferribacteraceae bacterium]|jgi:hypothetical protein|nr:hypothetical protein [Deferribacteraceae bacterium]
MAIPILNELSEELKRLYVAGSPLAKGDPRLSKYIAPLKKRGEKAAVFNTLSERIDALTNGSEGTSAEALMDASLLLYSLRYTQGSTAVTGEAKSPAYPPNPVSTLKIPYSQLAEAIDILSKGSKEHSEIPETLYKSGDYRDPRLFPYFVKGITDSSSAISNYVEENIIPALGNAIVPYLEEEFSIQGSKRHGRIFKLLHIIKGKGILPLAGKAATEGSAPVAAAAITALGEDAENEEILLAYAKDKKAEVRGSAFTALAKLNSQKGDELLLAELSKSGISHIENALTLTKNPKIFRRILDETEILCSDYKKNHSKLSVLFRILARSNDGEALKLLEKKIAAVVKTESIYLAFSEFDLDNLFKILSKGERKHLELYYRIACLPDKNSVLACHKFKVAGILFSTEKFFDECHSCTAQNLYSLYDIYKVRFASHTPDEQKRWDRRWGKIIAEKQPQLYELIYDNDSGAWKLLFETIKKQILQNKNTRLYPQQSGLLGWLFANKHPEAETYYKMLLKLGYSEKILHEYLSL